MAQNRGRQKRLAKRRRQRDQRRSVLKRSPTGTRRDEPDTVPGTGEPEPYAGFDDELAAMFEARALYDAELMTGDEWLELDEDERALAIEYFHWRQPRPHPLAPNPRLHGLIHMVVENQIARDEPAFVRATLLRLTGEGLTRHDAIHAIGTVVAAQIHSQEPMDEEAYIERLDALSRDAFLGVAKAAAKMG
jgi:Domain of unknown function (DUF1841)